MLLVCHEFATYYWSNFRDAPSLSLIDWIIINLISAEHANSTSYPDKVTVYRYKITVFVSKLPLHVGDMSIGHHYNYISECDVGD